MSMIGSVDGASPVIHPDAWVAPGAVVVGQLTLGRGTSVWYGSVLRGDADEIIVGADCNIQDLCCLHTDEGAPAVLACIRVTISTTRAFPCCNSARAAAASGGRRSLTG